MENGIPVGWHLKRLDQVADFLDGQRKPIKESVRQSIQGEYPYYGASGIIDYVNDYLFDDELILLGEDGANIINRSSPLAFRVSGKCWVNNHAHVIKPRVGTEIDFLVEYLESLDYSGLNSGTAQPKLNLASCQSIPVLVPPVEEQKGIADILLTWKRAIRQLTDLIAAKVRFKQGLMQQLLTGKRRFPEFKEEWKHVRLGDVVSVRKDARTPSEDCPLYSLTIENGITPKSDRYDRLALVRDKGSKKYKVVCPLDIVFNPSNLRWGAIGISRESQEVVVSPIYEVVYVSDEFAVDPFLLFQALSAPHQIARFATMCEGTLVERMAVKLPTFLNCHIPFPPTLSEQRRIADTLGVADRNICLLRQQLEALKQQKKALMLKLLTGQVRVKP